MQNTPARAKEPLPSLTVRRSHCVLCQLPVLRDCVVGPNLIICFACVDNLAAFVSERRAHG